MYRDVKIAIKCLLPYKRFGCLVVLVMLVSSLLEGVGIGIIIPILESVNNQPQQSRFADFFRTVFEAIGLPFDTKVLLIILAFVMILKYGFTSLQLYLNRVFASSVSRDLRRQAFESLMRVPMSYYYKNKTGDIIATMSISTAFAGGVVELFLSLTVALIFAIVYSVLALSISVNLILNNNQSKKKKYHQYL